MDQPESLHFERLQAGHNRKCSDWRLPWAAHQHLGRLTIEELQIDRKDWSAVPDGCLQSAQPSAVWESGWRQQPEYRAYRLQCSQHAGKSRIRNGRRYGDDLSSKCGIAAEHYAVCGSWYCEYVV